MGMADGAGRKATRAARSAASAKGRMPCLDMQRTQLLKQHVSKLRDDLVLDHCR